MASVTCVIPVYNGERFLGEAVESVLGQSLPPDEIIVMDDGSTDDTQGVAREFGSRIRYVHQENAGPATARNHGARLADGELLTFLDADDLWAEEKIELQVARFRERPELDLCWGLARNFWMEEIRGEEEEMRGHRRSEAIPAYVSGTLMVPTALFREVGGFDESLGHGDSADFYLRAKRAGAVSELLPQVLLHRRMHSENRSRQMAGDSLDEFFSILRKRVRQGEGGS